MGRRKSQDLGFCHQSKKHNFLVIGHAGGDPLGHCENTLEATRSALKLGANAIEVDIAISKDDVIFLWHDPNPLGLHSLARRLGFTIKGRCRPSMSINQNARELTWKQIEEFWFYDDLHFAGHRSHIKIPTLKEWLNEFGWTSKPTAILLKPWQDPCRKSYQNFWHLKFNLVQMLMKTECCFNESCHDWV